MCGATLRRLTASALCKFDKDFMSDATGEMQFAVGKTAGIEKLGFTLRALLEAYPELAVIQFDAVSAFNHISRERVLQRVRDVAPHLLAYAAAFLTIPSHAMLRKTDGTISLLRITAGLDLGDPLSPFLFALALPLPEIRNKLRNLLAVTAPDRAPSLLAGLMSYLDDLSLVIPATIAEEARTIVVGELAHVGLAVNEDKSLVYTASGECPEGCGDWWANAARHDGFLLCGSPHDANLANMDFDSFGDSVVMPIGNAEFVQDFLAGYVGKVEKFVAAVRAIPVHAQPGEPAVQVANLLLRHCASSKASHLLRALPTAVVLETAQRIDQVILDGFADINALGAAENSSAKSLIQMPVARGGLGLRSLSVVADAAHVAAWLHCAHSVSVAIGDVVPAMHDWSAAALPCQQHVHRAVQRMFNDYEVDVLSLCELDWAAVPRSERAKQQRTISRAFWDVEYDRWSATAPEGLLQTSLSGSSRGGRPAAGEWMFAIPVSQNLTLSDDAYRFAIRLRLGCRTQ